MGRVNTSTQRSGGVSIHLGGQREVVRTANIPHIIHQTWKTSQVPEKYHAWVVRRHRRPHRQHPPGCGTPSQRCLRTKSCTQRTHRVLDTPGRRRALRSASLDPLQRVVDERRKAACAATLSVVYPLIWLSRCAQDSWTRLYPRWEYRLWTDKDNRCRRRVFASDPALNTCNRNPQLDLRQW